MHKPLLTLMLLARAGRGLDRVVSFEEIRGPLARLLREFGPSRRSYHPEFPFWHLAADGFWTIRDAEAIAPKKSGRSPSAKTLEHARAAGSVTPFLWDALVGDAKLMWELSQSILEEFWPESVHAGIRSAIGLPADPPNQTASGRVKRDPRFREDVIRAYERRCAVCGYDGRLDDLPLGLDAAHIQWHAYRGPDVVQNGLALCSFHHVALDTGALGLSEDLRILVSADVTGGELVDSLLFRYAGAALRAPQAAYPGPGPRHVTWHQKEVFRAPARSGVPGGQGALAAAAEARGAYAVKPA